MTRGARVGPKTQGTTSSSTYTPCLLDARESQMRTGSERARSKALQDRLDWAATPVHQNKPLI